MIYRELVQVYSALTILSRRKLPSITNDLKVARIVKKLKPSFEVYEELRTAIVKDIDQNNKNEVANAEQKILELLRQDADVPDIGLTITKADLPLDLKGEEGQLNSAGLASIIIDLGPYFVDEDNK